MPRSTLIFILILTVLAGLLGYNYFGQPFNFPEKESAVIELAPTTTPVSASPPILAQLTPRQQVAQVLAVPYLVTARSSSASAALSWISHNQPGMVVLFGERISTSSAQAVIGDIKSNTPTLSPLIAVDHEGGRVQRLSGEGFTPLPSWQSLCASEPRARQDLLTKSAQELAQVGIKLIFAPVVDVASGSAILKNRVCSSEPEVVVARAQELIDVFEPQKIMPVIKHFPGIGSLTTDLHRGFGQVSLAPATVGVFQILLEQNSQLGVMTTHVGVKDLSPDTPCSLSSVCLADLRKYFFSSLIISDALDMLATGEGSLATHVVAAIQAGNDVVVFGPKVSPTDLETVMTQLEKLYTTEPEFKTQIQERVKKIDQYRELLK